MILTICNVTEALALLTQYTGLSPPRRESPMIKKWYTIQLQHGHKPGRRYYLDENICLSNNAKLAKRLSYEDAEAVLDYALGLVRRMSGPAANVEAKIVEIVADDEVPGNAEPR